METTKYACPAAKCIHLRLLFQQLGHCRHLRSEETPSSFSVSCPLWRNSLFELHNRKPKQGVTWTCFGVVHLPHSRLKGNILDNHLSEGKMMETWNKHVHSKETFGDDTRIPPGAESNPVINGSEANPANYVNHWNMLMAN